MRVGSLFAGIGGFDLAASRVWGWDCVRWQVEIDPWARRVLAKHWPDVPRFGDIRELTGEELEPVDLVCGGFPCQPFSQAGRRLGTEDDRYLWPEMLRIVQAVRPRWVVGENVPPLVRMGLDAVCAGLEGAGYTVGALGIPACAVGAPHRRERLWLVAHADDAGLAAGAPGASLTEGAAQPEPASRGGALAYAHSGNGHGRGGAVQVGGLGSTGEAAADGQPRGVQWSAEPGVGGVVDGLSHRLDRGGWLGDWERGIARVAPGVPNRIDRLRGLGNAIVPAVAEVLFRLIDEAEAER